MIKKIYHVIQRDGLFGFIKSAFVSVASRSIALPMAVVIILISPFVRIRFIKLFSSRIGHYSFNTEAILCSLDMNLEGDQRRKIIFYTLPGDPICNSQLHLMWKRTIPIFPLSYVAAEADKLLIRYGGKKYREYPAKVTFEPSGDGRDKWNLLEKIKKCHLSFTPQEEARGLSLLKEMGVPLGAPFICLLVRDSAYLTTYMPSIDWSYHDNRDADINSYQLAAQHLADRGYYVIRMGKVVKQPFLTDHPKVIDYANSQFRSDFMDIYLSAKCFFYLTTCSGLDSVACVFRKPLLVTNLVLQDFDIWHHWELFIPKKIMNLKTNKTLTFKEMKKLYVELKHKRKIPQLMREEGLRYIDNTPQEISDAVDEMLGLLSGKWKYSEGDNRLQGHFWEDFPRYLISDHVSPFNLPICDDVKMRVGTDFLKNNLSLLTDMEMSQVHSL